MRASTSAGLVRPIGRDVEVELACNEIADCGQMLVLGEAGIGKSVLLDVVARELDARGFVVVRAAGSWGLVDHPLAAIGHLVGDARDRAGPALTSMGVERLRAIARGDRAVIVVDDAHALDPTSLYVIARARADGGPRVLMTSRGGADLSSSVAQFGRFPGSTLVLQRLSFAETAELAAEVLGAGVDTPSARRIFEATDGLPLAVDELVREAKRRGALVLRAGLYRWDPTATTDRHLAGLLGLRVHELGALQRLVIDALAIAGDLPLEVIRELSDGCDLAELESQRLVTLSPRPGWLSIGHPLLRDAAVGQIGPIRRIDVARRLVDLLDSSEGDVVRLRVALAVDSGVPVPIDALVSVSAWARAHGLWAPMLPVMERAWTDSPSARTGLAYGEALYWTRQMDRAAEVLLAAEMLSASEADRVALATARARTLEIGLGRSGEATAIRTTELARTHDPAQRLELWCAEAERELFDGNVDRILDIAERAAVDWDESRTSTPMGAARYRLGQSLIGALGLAGRITDMADEYELHLALSVQHAGVHPLAREVVDPWWVACHLLAGDRWSASAVMEERYADALMLDDGLTRPLWALPKAIDCWLAGDLLAAEHFAREAMGVPDAVVSIRRMATHMLGRVLGIAGRRDESLAAAQATAGDDYVGIVTDWSVGLEHYALVVDHEFVSPTRRRASEQATLAAIRRLRRQRQLVAAAWVAHDLVRSGGAHLVADELADLATGSDAASIGWISEHASGVVSNDVGRLVACAEAASSAGCHSVAVCVADDAASAAIAIRDVRRAAEVGALVEELRRRTNGIAAARDGEGLGDRFGLTPREAEVARAASSGLTDQQIGEQLFISVRTVNAHLRAVYRKLGVSGRSELPAV